MSSDEIHSTHRDPWDEPRRRRRGAGSRLLIGVGIALVVLVGGSAAFAFSALRGGGAQPEGALPSTALAFAKVDLDPAAGQKIQAARFLSKLPDTGLDLDEESLEDTNLRREIFESIQQDDAGLGELDYETDVEPWLGQRMGVAILPPVEGAPPEVSFVLALQVTDAGQAQAELERLVGDGGDDGETYGGDGGETYGVVVGSDYALIAETQELAQAAADAAQDASLAEAEDFSADMATIGEDGIAAFWVDVEAAGAAAQDFSGETFSGETGGLGAAAFRGSGRYAAVLRFDDRNVELAGGAFGVEQLVAPEGEATSGIGELPDSTVAAVSLSHGDQLVDAAWTSLRDKLASLGVSEDFDAAVAESEASYGLSLPADLATMLGSNLLLAVDEESLDEETRAEQGVTVGAAITTDADAAEDVLDALDQAAARELGGEGLGIVRQRTEDGVILASTQDYASRLAQPGSLGEDEVFALAVPDAEQADLALWADLEQILPVALAELPDGEGQEFAEVLGGVGATMTIDGDGAASFTMRLVLR